ncbi:hypothetical protein PILCRDRAFT_14866, partial [Piloderma croceum F 1598]
MPSAAITNDELAPTNAIPSQPSTLPSASASVSPCLIPSSSSSGSIPRTKPTATPTSRAVSSAASATSSSKDLTRSSSLEILFSSDPTSPAITPPPCPKPHLVRVQTSSLPVLTYEPPRLPLPQILLPYPCICASVNKLAGEDRVLEITRMALSSDDERNWEELRLENEELFLSLDSTQFQALYDDLGGDLGLGFLSATDNPEMEEQRGTIEANIDSNVTPR